MPRDNSLVNVLTPHNIASSHLDNGRHSGTDDKSTRNPFYYKRSINNLQPKSWCSGYPTALYLTLLFSVTFQSRTIVRRSKGDLCSIYISSTVHIFFEHSNSHHSNLFVRLQTTSFTILPKSHHLTHTLNSRDLISHSHIVLNNNTSYSTNNFNNSLLKIAIRRIPYKISPPITLQVHVLHRPTLWHTAHTPSKTFTFTKFIPSHYKRNALNTFLKAKPPARIASPFDILKMLLIIFHHMLFLLFYQSYLQCSILDT